MNFRKTVPYILALLLFGVVSAAYFAPQFMGKSLVQSDMTQYLGMTQDILEHREAYGEDPQWAGRLFSGMPSYLINFKHDGTFIRTISKAFYFLGGPAALIFIAMSCFFFMLLCYGIPPWVSVPPSLAYGLSTFFFIIIGVGHTTQMMALAFAPMVLGGVFYAYRKNMWLGAALAGFFGSIQISVNHFQITYYFILFIALAYVISELVRALKDKTLPRFAKTTGLLLVAGILAVGSNASQLYYIKEVAPYTIRGGSELSTAAGEKSKGTDLEYATAWSYGIGETLDLLVPNLYGGASDRGFSDDGQVATTLQKYDSRGLAAKLPGYWGDQPVTSGPVYIGAVAMLIAVLGLFVLRRRRIAWVCVVTIVAVLLAWGRNMMWFTELFYNYFPLYSSFRTVSMILVVVEWSVPFLMALTLYKLWTAEIDKKTFLKGLIYATSITGGLLLLMLLFGSAFMSFTGGSDAMFAEWPQEILAAMQAERASMMRADALRSLLFVLLAAGLIWLFYKGHIKKWAFIALLCGLIIVDMVPVNLRYMGMDRFVDKEDNRIRPTAADQAILADKEPGFRVANFTLSTFNDATTSYFHRSVGGYHGAKLARYQDLIERHLGKMNPEAYNMLNTKYFIVPEKENSTVAMVQQNPDANGAAWFVDEVLIVEGAEAEISALNNINTKRTAAVDKPQIPAGGFDALDMAADSAAVIEMTEYRVNRQIYRYNAPADGVAVFSEVFYDKGWKAYLDGQEAPYFRADYILRAMVLPAGEHTVEFHFRAPHFDTLATINRISSLILILGVSGAVALVIVKKRRKKRV